MGQRPYFDFLSFDSANIDNNYDILKNKEFNSKELQPPTNNSPNGKYTINFANSYNNIPEIVLSLRTTTCDSSSYLATITEITKNSVTFYVTRIDSTSKWN